MTTKKKATKKDLSTEQKIGLGVGLTAAAVAAAGAYFLYGSESAAKNRKVVKSWALKAKSEVLEKLEDAKEMTTDEYEELIAAVAGTYAGVKGASKKDLKEFTNEMQDHWKSIEKFAKPKKKVVKKVAKKVTTKVKPVAKKAAKKTTKK
jgi:gas vesicle protein